MNTIANYINAFSNFSQTPTLVCEDGFSVSVQVSQGHYCQPRQDMADARDYNSMELGFPNKADDLLTPYAENPNAPTETVYGYVPVNVINEIIAKHGGLKRPF